MPIIYPSGGIKKAVGHMGLPQREERRTGFGCPGVYMVFKALGLVEIKGPGKGCR